jgi:AcrR family transcriptional regulator
MSKRPKSADATASAREARKERRRDQTRAEILAAARKVLIAGGVGAMTLEAVAAEAGMSKTGLYHYFASKDALLFELVYGVLERHVKTVRDAVEAADDAEAALRGIVGETVDHFATRLDDFRLAFMYGQVATAGEVAVSQEQLARLRPLNDMLLAGAAERLGAQGDGSDEAYRVAPRKLAFLAYLAALGILTMKGIADRFGDPLLYSDEELTEALVGVLDAGSRRA